MALAENRRGRCFWGCELVGDIPFGNIKPELGQIKGKARNVCRVIFQDQLKLQTRHVSDIIVLD